MTRKIRRNPESLQPTTTPTREAMFLKIKVSIFVVVAIKIIETAFFFSKLHTSVMCIRRLMFLHSFQNNFILDT